MKILLCTLLLATFGVTAAEADTVSIVFDKPTQVATPGATLSFFGTITNLTNTFIALNNDDLNLAGLSFTTTDQFFGNVPSALSSKGQPGATSGDIDLFDITVSSPFLGPGGTFSGVYTLFGGSFLSSLSAQDNLGSTGFSLTSSVPTVPEPASIYLLLAGLSTTLLPISRRLRNRP